MQHDVFPLLPNDIIVLRRSRGRVLRRFLNSLERPTNEKTMKFSRLLLQGLQGKFVAKAKFASRGAKIFLNLFRNIFLPRHMFPRPVCAPRKHFGQQSCFLVCESLNVDNEEIVSHEDNYSSVNLSAIFVLM